MPCATPPHSTDRICTRSLPPQQQFAAWREAIVDAHLSWDIPNAEYRRFPAYLCQHRFADGLRLTDCNAPAEVQGSRQRAQMRRDDDAFISVCFVAEGREVLRFADGREAAMSAGQFTLWDSTEPLQFATGNRLRQIALMVPRQRMLRQVPRVRELLGARLEGTHGGGGLFLDHLRALLPRLAELSPPGRESALDLTIDLLGLCLREQAPLPPPRLGQAVLQRMLRHIDAQLADPALGVASLAREFRITERGVHRLFEPTGSSVGATIRNQRLAACRRDLASPLLAQRQVGEIARHWGFVDLGHFGKLFRAAFGQSPSEYRASGSGCAADFRG